jgi:hypothetical protein
MKNKLSLFKEGKKDIVGIKKKAQSTKNLETNKIFSMKLKNNKFYLAICSTKTNDIYKCNKHLRKWNEKLNQKSSNNRTNRKIYIQKTTMLLNIQEKIKCFIYNEKNNLKMNKITNESQNKTNIYFDEILKGKKINKEEENLLKKKRNK